MKKVVFKDNKQTKVVYGWGFEEVGNFVYMSTDEGDIQINREHIVFIKDVTRREWGYDMSEPTIKEVYEEIRLMKDMIVTLLRSKQSNKLNRVEDEIMHRGRISTKQVMDFVNVTRPTAIGYLEKLGKKLGFKYYVGDKARKRASVCIYDKSAKFEQQKQRFEALFVSQNVIPMVQIMNLFGLTIDNAKDLVYLISNETGKYRIKDENKVEKFKWL